jgi:hypothetical protein
MNVITILNELAASAGQDAVREACTKFLGGKKAAKVKKERKPRGKSSWNLEVDKVLEEMRAAARAAGASEEEAKKKATYKLAFAEASRRRRENNPEAQAKYELAREAKVKKADSAPAAQGGQSIADVLDYGDTPPDTDEDDEGVCVDGVASQYDAGTVYRFLFDLQESGRINMLACCPELQREFGMTGQEADDVRAEYVTRYGELKAKYGRQVTPARRASAVAVPKAPVKPKKPLPAGRSKIPIV